ncbi:MAG: hypothetical protein AB1414_12830 [bacterium]
MIKYRKLYNAAMSGNCLVPPFAPLGENKAMETDALRRTAYRRIRHIKNIGD